VEEHCKSCAEAQYLPQPLEPTLNSISSRVWGLRQRHSCNDADVKNRRVVPEAIWGATVPVTEWSDRGERCEKMEGDRGLTGARRPRLLIVENDLLLAETLKCSIGGSRFEVVGVADSEREAVRLAHAGAPSLALMDLHLRHGDNGCIVSRVLWDKLYCPSLFYTASPDYVIEHRCGIGCLAKPAIPLAIIGAMSLALEFVATGVAPEGRDGLRLWAENA